MALPQVLQTLSEDILCGSGVALLHRFIMTCCWFSAEDRVHALWTADSCSLLARKGAIADAGVGASACVVQGLPIHHVFLLNDLISEISF